MTNEASSQREGGFSKTAGGSSKAPFVLLHGFAQNSKSWNEVASVLRSQGHAVYVPNLMSAKSCVEEEESLQGTPLASAYAHLRSASCMDELCAGVLETLRAVVTVQGRPPVLVGYSMGGRIALETLVRIAEVATFDNDLPLAGIVLESAGTGPANAEERADFAERNNQWVAKLRTEGLEAFMDWWENLPLFDSQHALPQSVRDGVRAERMGCCEDDLAAMLDCAGQHRQSYEETALAALASAIGRGLDALYVTGALDTRYAGLAKRLHETGPFHVEIVEDAGHNVHLERPDVFVDLLLALSADLDEAAAHDAHGAHGAHEC